MNSLSNKMQSVVLTFNDGTVATFIGKAVCLPNDNLILEDIKFTMPMDIPKDCSFELLSEIGI